MKRESISKVQSIDTRCAVKAMIYGSQIDKAKDKDDDEAHNLTYMKIEFKGSMTGGLEAYSLPLFPAMRFKIELQSIISRGLYDIYTCFHHFLETFGPPNLLPRKPGPISQSKYAAYKP